MISDLLHEFIKKADTHVVGRGADGSPTEIIGRTFTDNFRGLQVKGSFGVGRATPVPWIGFTGYGQLIRKGIYPVFLYFKEQRRLVLAYGISEDSAPDREWTGIEGKQTIREYFATNGLEIPTHYGNSFVHNVYETKAELDEAEIQRDLDAVVERFHSIFENNPAVLDNDASLIPSILLALESREVQELLDEEDFHFEKGRQMLETYEAIDVDQATLTTLLSDYENTKGSFKDKLDSYSVDSEAHRLLLTIGKVVSYCDSNAANKNIYNQYDDKRVLARSSVRQGDWVKNLIKYKLNGNQKEQISDSIGNALSYLKHPMTGLTMLSENHREMVSRNLLDLPNYDKKGFVDEVLNYFKPYSITPKNPENLTRIISNILYLYDDVRKLWWHEESIADGIDSSISTSDGEPDLNSIEFQSIGFGNTYRAVLTAIKTKPFVLLAGLSGTGKSRLVRSLAYLTCFDPRLRDNLSKPGNFELVAVKPNWHDSGELMGYVSRINNEKYLTTSFLKFVAKAWKFPNVPFFLCLDEMNLAPVEQYFAEYLSIVETRAMHAGRIQSDYLLSRSQFENPGLYTQLLKDLGLEGDTAFVDGLSIPTNLIVVGTVNMDETTHSFSRKVLDRAMTFEMNIVDLNAGLSDAESDWSYPDLFVRAENVVGEYSAGSEVVHLYPESREVIDYLVRLNEVLDGTPFRVAYRVRDEFLIYCYYSSVFEDKPDNWLETALDEMTAMKILSRIEGDEPKTAQVLAEFDRIVNENFPITSNKLNEMRKRLQISGYTSFWS